MWRTFLLTLSRFLLRAPLLSMYKGTIPHCAPHNCETLGMRYQYIPVPPRARLC